MLFYYGLGHSSSSVFFNHSGVLSIFSISHVFYTTSSQSAAVAGAIKNKEDFCTSISA